VTGAVRAVRRVVLVGSGAREHAMAAAIARSKDAVLLAVMKHRNPGIAALAEAVHIHDELDVAGIVAWAADQRADVAVIGPEAPEEKGLADAFEAAGIACASPTKAAARIETDKTFMRRLMESHDIAGRLAFHRFDDERDALAFLEEHGPEWAIKPVGLTGGKGVQVYGDHFTDLDGAKAYVQQVFAARAGGGALQLEELAVGEEFTLMALTDGKTVLPMIAVQDHKRLYEGDKGPNTGGMGSYSQADGLLPFLTQSEYDDAVEIIEAVVAALAADGAAYRGAIYGQFMLTPHGPRVIEFNARFGDPEAMNVLQVLETDYVLLLQSIVTGKLHNCRLAFRPNATVVKYAVPKGYGDGRPLPGAHVTIDEKALAASGATLYYGAVEQA
jgi:phosphoribosylamine--glycine ligase